MKEISLLFVTSKSLGGSGKYITVLAAALRKKGINCEIIYYRTGVAQDDEIESSFSKVHYFSKKPGLSPLTCLANALQVRNVLRQGKFSVIHTHTSIGGLVGRLGAKLSGLPELFVGHTIHAYGADEFTPRPQKWLYWLIERALDVITDAYVSPSQYMVDYGRRTRVIDAQKATVIYNSLPLNAPPSDINSIRAAKREQLSIPQDHCMLLFCGRLEKQKGVDVLIQALQRTSNDLKIHLVICGTGDQDTELKILASSLGLDQRITWAGWQSDVAPFYMAADVYVMASRWESFGLVFLEAMNYGLPILSTSTQAIPEVVRSEVTGLLSPSEDAAMLAENIEKLAINSSLRKKLGMAGKQRLNDNFGFEKFVDKNIDWYKNNISLKLSNINKKIN